MRNKSVWFGKRLKVAAVMLASSLTISGCMDAGTVTESEIETFSDTADASKSEIISESVYLSESEDISLEDNNKESEFPADTRDLESIFVSDVKVKGIYVTGPAAGSERLDDLIDLVKNTELNTMVIDIKSDEGIVTYKIDCAEAKAIGACIGYVTDMPATIQRLHDEGIYTIGRIACFKDPILAGAKPEYALCKPDGTPITDSNGIAWVNPYEDGVWDYICSLAEQASKDGFDEIQFDYVRFPIGSDANAADYKVDTTAYPKQECLNNFFAYAKERLHDKGIIFGADLFGTVIGSNIDMETTGQNYAEISKLADCVCPMVYPSHYAPGSFNISVPDAKPYETIKGAMDKSVSVLDANVDEDGNPVQMGVVRPWLQCFTATWVSGHISYGPEEIKGQIRGVYDAGYDEWILWNSSCHYDLLYEALAIENVN